jgi:hypothetical protein
MRIKFVASALAIVVGCVGCGSSRDEGAAAAKAEAEADLKKRLANKEAAKKISPPVPGGQTVACTTLIDPAAFTTALQEQFPLTLKEITETDADSVAVCSLIRGGKKLTPKEQEALIKKRGSGGRLGVLAGDELCRISAFCWTLEEEEKFYEGCKSRGLSIDESTMGSKSCLQIVPQGADDVYSFQFLDEDTKCVIKVGGGPSLVDNGVITTCAKTARQLIGPPNIKPGKGAPPAAPPAEQPATGSGGSAAPQ